MYQIGHYKISTAHIAYAVLGVALLIFVIVLASSLIRRRSQDYYDKRWKDVQKLLSKKTTWKEAVINADCLLDELLKKRRYKGKTMGERLVSAQHDLSANDMVWYSHKFKTKLESGETPATKAEVKKCLLGFWQALKDLGAFKQ